METVAPTLIFLGVGGALLRPFHGVAKLQQAYNLLALVCTIFTSLEGILELPPSSNLRFLVGQND